MKIFSAFSRLLAPAIGFAVFASMMVVGTSSANAAANAVKCKGFTACSGAKLSNYGYAAVYKKSFWNATAGHNCTNYVAYRLSHNGRLVDIPSRLGNASNWGVNAAAEGIPVAQAPRVGDVAWWSYLKGNKTRSHVAMVERVYADGSVMVSEDNLAGDFDWRTIAKGGAYWPSGFIRFPQSDGSPHGFLKPATNTNGRVQINAFVDEADSPNRASLVTVSFGGPLGASGTTVQKVSTPLSGNWYLYRTFAAGSIPTVAYVYANNTKGTGGKDLSYGKVTIPSGTAPTLSPAKKVAYATKASYRFSKKVIKRSQYAYANVTVARTSTRQHYPYGRVQIKVGSKVLTSKYLSSAGHYKVKIRLPKLKKGTYKVHVRYLGNAESRADSSTVATLKVV